MKETKAFVGIAIRTVTDLTQIVAQAIINAPAIRKSYENGKPVQTAFELFDKNEEDASGGGFPMTELATVNLGIPGVMNSNAEIEGLKKNLEQQYHYMIPMLTNPVACVEEYLYHHGSKVYKETEAGNPCAWAMHMNSFDQVTGKLIANRACIPRMVVFHTLIKLVLPKLQAFLKNINAVLDLPFSVPEPAITLNVHWNTEIISFDCDTDHPKLLAKQGDEQWWMHFDYLTINSGAAFGVLQSTDPRVNERTVPHRFTSQELKDIYKKFGLLKANGKFTEGARIGVPGRKLFSYDKKTNSIPFIDHNIVLKHDLQLVQVGEKKGESTFVTYSRTKNEILQPRLGADHEYKGDLNLFQADFAHSCLLQKAVGTAHVLVKMADIDTSFTMGIPLDEIYKELDTKDLLARHAEEIERFINPKDAGPVLGQVRRANRQALALYGKGLTTKRTGEEAELCIKYPSTRPGVAGWVHDKFIDILPGQTPFVLKGTNVAYDQAWKHIMDDVTGPPVENALPMTQLVLQGHDKHIVGDANNVVFDEARQKLRLGDEFFDVQHATLVLSSCADPLINENLFQLKNNGAGLPELAKGRHLQSTDGRLLPIAYFGSAVEGAKVLDGTGTYSTAGRQAADITSWDGATETGPLKAKFMLLVTLLAALERDNPLQYAIDLYWSHLPTEDEHEADTAEAEEAWKNGWSQLNFYDLVSSVTNDLKEQKKILQQYAKEEDTRQEFIAKLKRQGGAAEKLATYAMAMEKVPKYVPTTRDEFHKGIIDFQPQYLDKAMKTVTQCIENGNDLPSLD
jgi:hypothetical protein